MEKTGERRQPGEVRDAVIATVRAHPDGVVMRDIVADVGRRVGADVAVSSVHSYLRLNTPGMFRRLGRGQYQWAAFRESNSSESGPSGFPSVVHGRATVIHGDCMEWLREREPASIHAVVTDPPYGLVEYSAKEQSKLRAGKRSVWRIPPSFDGARQSPLPRFTVLSSSDREDLAQFFATWAALLA